MLTLAFFIAYSSLAAPELSGAWEIQSMGSDRTVTVQQKDKKVLVHRVMWPEFEGERYKLEHLYRGTMKGDAISGKLLVKEDELPDWEVLRAFTGSLKDGNLVIDGMPMKRLGAAAPAAAPEPDSSHKRVSPPPAMSNAKDGSGEDVAVAVNTPPPSAPPPAASSEGPSDPGGLFANIMGTPGMQDLFMVSSRITIPNPVADLTLEGDTLFARGRYAAALTKYEAAVEISRGTHPELVHRMGRCYLKLKKYHEAQQMLRRAVRLDPHNERVRNDYRTAKERAG